MLKPRKGFTLIELLIVIVIIGILAAIAIPKFGATREKAYFKAIMSDLRNLQTQQEVYYSQPTSGYSYTTSLADLQNFTQSQGVTAPVIALSTTGNGWSATASHQALAAASQFCAIFIGDATAVAPATVAGVVTCTGE
jgi:type IV pilus assembly protein PilA